MYDACVKAITTTYGSEAPKIKRNPSDLGDDAFIIVKGAILDGNWLSASGLRDTYLMCGEAYSSIPEAKEYFVHLYNRKTSGFHILYEGTSVDHATHTYLFEVGMKVGIKSVIEILQTETEANSAHV